MAASETTRAASAATDALDQSIASNSQKVSLAPSPADDAVQQAAATFASVAGLQEDAAKVRTILDLATRIARQTDVLTLNAAIKSARAGDAGRRHAVVSSEVKSLANETGRTTAQIGEQIQRKHDSAATVAEEIMAIRNVARHIDEAARGIIASLDEQNVASGAITRGSRVAEGVLTMTGGTRRGADDRSGDPQPFGAATRRSAQPDRQSHHAAPGSVVLRGCPAAGGMRAAPARPCRSLGLACPA